MKALRYLYSKYRILLRFFWLFKAKKTAKSIGLKMFIGGPISLNNNTIIGSFCSTNGMIIRGNGEVVINDYLHTGNDLLIISSNHNYKNADYLPYDEKHEKKKIYIDKAVWIGDRVTILGNINIGEGAIIQAGSVVVSDIPALAIAGGNPAKVFSYRDESHYNNLVKSNKFNKLGDNS